MTNPCSTVAGAATLMLASTPGTGGTGGKGGLGSPTPGSPLSQSGSAASVFPSPSLSMPSEHRVQLKAVTTSALLSARLGSRDELESSTVFFTLAPHWLAAP